jgi:hypothetical protein
MLKTVFKIAQLQSLKEHRYIALLCAKLLLIVINLQIVHRVQQAIDRPKDGTKKWVLSVNKALKTLSCMFEKIFRMLRSNRRQAQVIAVDIQMKLSKNHFLERKKNKLCFPEIIDIFICNSEE